jgi:transposase
MDNFAGMTVGVDLADRCSSICIVGKSGEIVKQCSVPTCEDAFRSLFAHGAYDRVVIEACTNASWVGWMLSKWGQRVVIAHPRSIGLIHQSTRKNDARDAEKLARLARVDESLVHPTHLRSRERTEALADIRARAALVRTRTHLVNTARALAKMTGTRIPRCTTEGFPEHVDDLQKWRPTLYATLRPLAMTVAEITNQIRLLEKGLSKLTERFPETARLQAIHGIGEVTALTFVLVIDDPARFPRTRDIGAYLGLVPKQDQTGESDKALRISKEGHRYLRGLLTQCAKKILSSRSPESDLKRWGTSIAARGGKRAKQVATVAVARRLAVTMLAMWKSGGEYRASANDSL